VTAGTEILPHQARVALEEYLAAVKAALPGIVCGIYLTGSAALGDWQPGRSDLDILTVTQRHLKKGELAALEALHAALRVRPYRDAIYIPAKAIGTRPALLGEAAQAWTPPTNTRMQSTESFILPATAPTQCCGHA
jgi:Nucleotidyltransferase domain